jgi:hypothetical protein
MAASKGKTPLEYVLDLMNDPTIAADRRDWAAETAMGYVHPRLAMTAVQTNDGRPRQTGIKVQFILPRGYSRDEVSGQIIEGEPLLKLEREPEETEH